jgi:undecaprenyl-diphosphatase
VNSLEAAFLGLVQGLTEFLPVSSSGHLVILQALLGVGGEGVLFEVSVHLATLGSVLLFYRQRVGELALGSLTLRPEALRYVGKLALATLPAVLTVLWIGDLLEAQFESIRSAGVCLILTGGIVWTTRRTVPGARLPEPSWAAALAIGCAQAFAILPGISRSGATVATALALGVAPAAAAEFSVLMSVIAIVGAAVRTLPELGSAGSEPVGVLLAGGAVAFVSGIAAIWLFVRLLRSQGFHRFAYYAWAVGALTLLVASLW